MDSQLLTLSKIFTERLFRIPDYQRGYAWTEKQLKDFWTDVQQLEAGRNHYTGVLTLESVPESTYRTWSEDYWIVDAKSYQPFYVVDGQQRLTTTIILVSVILDRIGPSDMLNYTEKPDIQRKFIFDSKGAGISRSYIFGYERDNPSYEFLKTKIFGEKSSSATSEETIYTNNLTYAKEFFRQRISDASITELETLFKKVTQHLLFNIFTITEDVDVCVAFETMNNRGKPLSYLELLKNRLIYLSLKFEEPEYERLKLRRAINDCWKSIYHNLGRNRERPLEDDRFLLTHYVCYFGKIIFDELVEVGEQGRFRRLVRSDYATDLLEKRFIPKNVSVEAPADARISLTDIYNYVSSLQDAVQTWYKIYNPFDSDLSPEVKIWLDKLNRIGFEPYQALVLIFLQRVSADTKRLAFLQAVERQLFLTSLASGYFGGTRFGMPFESEANAMHLVVEFANDRISADRVIRAITDTTNLVAKQTDFIKESQSRFRAEGFYEWRGIRYFLFEYNLDLQLRSKTDRPKINWPEFAENASDYMSVEHIFPQHARHAYWNAHFGGLPQKQRASLRNSLGNLLPLSRPKNSSLSNRPFPDKIDGKGDPVVGFRYGSYAENEVSKHTDWTPQAILDRGLKIRAESFARSL